MPFLFSDWEFIAMQRGPLTNTVAKEIYRKFVDKAPLSRMELDHGLIFYSRLCEMLVQAGDPFSDALKDAVAVSAWLRDQAANTSQLVTIDRLRPKPLYDGPERRKHKR